MPLIKECDVLQRNSEVIVVNYDGKLVQLPFDNSVSNKVYVMFNNNKYTLSNQTEFDKQAKKKTTKKKTVETELVGDIVSELKSQG